MKVEIKCKDILYIILWICLFQGVISDYVGFHQINYLCDVLLIFLLVTKIYKGNLKIDLYKKGEYIPIFMFINVVLLGWAFNSVSILQAVWGIRNYGRFFLFFIFACTIWDYRDVVKIENFFIKLFPFHIGLVIFQYFFEGLKQDNLSGIFGRTAGGNGGLIIYLLIILCIIITRFEYKRIGIFSFITYLSFIFLNAALSELKFLFIATILFMGLYFFLCEHKVKGIILSLFFILLLYVGIRIFYHVFHFWENYLTFENILKMILDQKTYANQDDIWRTAVFSKLTPILSQWGGAKALIFGIGLGNGDYSSSYQVLNSYFYQIYEKTHYTWLSLGYLFVETGYLGTIFYLSFFIVLEIKAICFYLKKAAYFNYLGIFLPLVFMILIVYNSTLRSNFAYMAFTVLTWQILYNKKIKYYRR